MTNNDIDIALDWVNKQPVCVVSVTLKQALEVARLTISPPMPKAAENVDIATNEEWFLERVDHDGGAIDYEIKQLKSNGTEWDDNWIKVMGANAKGIANRIYRSRTAPTQLDTQASFPHSTYVVVIDDVPYIFSSLKDAEKFTFCYKHPQRILRAGILPAQAGDTR